MALLSNSEWSLSLPTFPTLPNVVLQGFVLIHFSGNFMELVHNIYAWNLSDYWLFNILKMKKIEHIIVSFISFLFTAQALFLASAYYPKLSFYINKFTITQGVYLFIVLLILEKFITRGKKHKGHERQFWLIDFIPPLQIISALVENRAYMLALPPIQSILFLLGWFISCCLIQQVTEKIFVFIKYALVGIVTILTIQHANPVLLFLALSVQAVLCAKYIWLHTLHYPSHTPS